MSLSPLQTNQLVQAARDLVKGLPADAVLLLTETALDWEEVGRMLVGCTLFVAAENPNLTKNLRDNPDWQVIDLDPNPLPTQERMSNALLKAVATEKLKAGANVVVLYNGITSTEDAPEPIDSISVLHLGEHLEKLTPRDLRVLGPVVPLDVLRSASPNWPPRSAGRGGRASRSAPSWWSATPGGCSRCRASATSTRSAGTPRPSGTSGTSPCGSRSRRSPSSTGPSWSAGTASPRRPACTWTPRPTG